MLKQQIDNDLKEALKNKNALLAGTLRMLKSRVKNEEIAKQKEFDDAEIQTIIGSEIKRRKDSVAAYTLGNRLELAAQEQDEISMLEKYLSEQLSEQEIANIIDQTLEGTDFTSSDFGKAMAAVMPSLKGKADGSVVSKLLKEKLK